MAAGLLTVIATSRGLTVDVRTAGLAHHPGRRVAQNAVIVMAELGVDISGESSKPVSLDGLVWADLVVAVQRDHAEHLIEDFPQIASKVRFLESDVRDPYCGPVTEYREVRDTLQDLLSRLMDSLQ